MTLAYIRFAIAAVLMLAGLFHIVSSVVGNLRFKFVLSRMQAAAVGDTLGVLFMLLGLVVMRGFCLSSLKMLFVIVFLWLSGPVSSHMLVKLELTGRKNDREDEK